eukprot:scaffold1997_cov318-Pavlova_lutheri.AAC.18
MPRTVSYTCLSPFHCALHPNYPRQHSNIRNSRSLELMNAPSTVVSMEGLQAIGEMDARVV